MITVRALGPADLRVDGKAPPPELLWRKNLALLVYLARSPHRTRTREHLMGLLWGDRPPSSARHSLREAIRAIRSGCGEQALVAEADNLRLEDGVVQLDVEQLERACTRGDWHEAARLATGEFLEGFAAGDAGEFEDWLSAERHAVRRLSVQAIAHASEDAARSGDLDQAKGLARRALLLDPLSAAATAALMTACALSGERADALAVFDMYARAFESATGSPPDASMQRLAERVRRERGPRAPAPVTRGAESRRAPLTGRTTELEKLIGWWDRCRTGTPAALVIDGDPGSGRTRTAEEIAARARMAGATVAQVRGTPADRTQAWSGVFALARGGLLDAPGITAAAGNALGAFTARIEEWADRLPGVRSATPLEPGLALSAVVRAAAAEQPVLIEADDAHWLDDESLAAFQSLLRDSTGLPVCLMVTASTSQPRDALEQLRVHAGRDVGGVTVRLGPLDGDAMRDLARWAMPSYDAAASERLARRITADSAGLPLLAVELLHAVALGLDLESSKAAWPAPQRTLDQTMPGELPETIVAAIRIGFRRLSANAQLAVAALAVLGDGGTAALPRATGLPAEALADALDEAEWQRWLVADGRGYSFVARITREVVATDMVTSGQRRRFQESLTTA